MLSNQVGPGAYGSLFTFFQTLCVKAAKALARLDRKDYLSIPWSFMRFLVRSHELAYILRLVFGMLVTWLNTVLYGKIRPHSKCIFDPSNHILTA